MTDRAEPQLHFEGEEAGTGFAPPILDLIATGVLMALAVIVMVASVALPVPGGLRTAPGLLPFLVGGSLLAMAIGLGLSAVRRRRSGVRSGAFSDRDTRTDLRTLALAAAVALYIAALQLLAFRYDVVVGGFRHTVTAFEPVTAVMLAAIIHVSWRGALWITAAISLSWVAILSTVFQHVFKIPLPGSF